MDSHTVKLDSVLNAVSMFYITKARMLRAHNAQRVHWQVWQAALIILFPLRGQYFSHLVWVTGPNIFIVYNYTGVWKEIRTPASLSETGWKRLIVVMIKQPYNILPKVITQLSKSLNSGAQSKGHKDMDERVWCGRTWLSWRQPDRTPLGWIRAETASQALSSNICLTSPMHFWKNCQKFP